MVVNLFGKIIDNKKIEKDKQLERQFEEVKERIDLDKAQMKESFIPRNNVNFKNPRSWLELAVVCGFIYSVILVPMLNDLFSLHLIGIGEEVKELLYAMIGLGSYRLAEKFVDKR